MKFVDIIKTNGSTHYITLPKSQLDDENLRKGDYVEAIIKKTEVIEP